jgi:predicted nucleic acid-binding protein
MTAIRAWNSLTMRFNTKDPFSPQGFSGPKARTQILERFRALPLIVPQREDHIAAADLRNECRRQGLQIGTIDALLARLCIRHDLVMLSTDRDFEHLSGIAPLRLWAKRPPQ